MRERLTFLVWGMWFGSSCLIDFFVVPVIFRSGVDISIAGNLGIKIFSVYNNLEIVLALLLIVLTIPYLHVLWGKIVFINNIMLAAITLLYKFYLTPQITYFAEKMALDSQNFAEYGLYHNVYVKVEYLKIFILIALLIIYFLKEKMKKSAGVKK